MPLDLGPLEAIRRVTRYELVRPSVRHIDDDIRGVI